jgi:hypothetical protein
VEKVGSGWAESMNWIGSWLNKGAATGIVWGWWERNMQNGSMVLANCQRLLQITAMLFERRGRIRMGWEEVAGGEGVGRGVMILLGLWKCVEKCRGPGRATKFRMDSGRNRVVGWRGLRVD